MPDLYSVSTLIESGRCPYGGDCIDTNYPSDCAEENKCLYFCSKEQRRDFEALPDSYFFWSPGSDLRLFKEKFQLAFYLANLGGYWQSGAAWGKVPSRKIRDFLLSNPGQNILPVPVLLDLNKKLDEPVNDAQNSLEEP